MKTIIVLSSVVVILQVIYISAAGGDRQPPTFFQTGKPFNAPGAPLPKFVGIGGSQPPQAFRSQAPQVDEEQEDEEQRDEEELNQRNILIPTPLPFRPQPTQHQFNQFRVPPSPSPQTLQPIRINRPTEDAPRRQSQQQQQQFKPFAHQPLSEEAQELEEEKEEPDRLTELLPQSKFSCSGKKTGYYADDGLNCEVFHYCQDNARHSWICPEGFVFHQVHLICLPPSSENICKDSSQYHFVNDFLYKPVNAEEAQTRPNVTIRYADRYYPTNSFENEEEYEREEAPQHRPQQFRQQPVIRQRVQQPQPQQTQQVQILSSPRPIILQQQPQQFARQPLPNQVFHSSEEVNIPLQQRRPTLQSQQRPQFQQQQQQSNEFDFERK
ncbi:putative mediator of RNA polymerase II transcription subunit 26 [Daktulosphaira vitifoliae]|uniref:putative mediator of RNA polymerase II transcription subunit 26 n=1 Tax=Daktulosphaira vitifoliae TaxID=58002 RepID=UPI0021AA1A76|nr:putative mediator of RNA polymerase II transcription subunit 26 [Daktulosphaira vitifoliae]